MKWFSIELYYSLFCKVQCHNHHTFGGIKVTYRMEKSNLTTKKHFFGEAAKHNLLGKTKLKSKYCKKFFSLFFFFILNSSDKLHHEIPDIKESLRFKKILIYDLLTKGRIYIFRVWIYVFVKLLINYL